MQPPPNSTPATIATPTAEQWLAIVVEISRQIANLSPLTHILQSVVKASVQSVRADLGAIALLNHDRSQLLVECFHLAGDPVPVPQQHPVIDVAIISRVVQSGHPMLFPQDCTSAETKWSCAITSKEIRSAAIVPLSLDGTIIGALWVARHQVIPFAEDIVVGLSQLADQTVIALEHATMASQIQSIAIAEERYRIAREMHDSLAQVLGYLNVQMQTLELLVKAGDVAVVLDEIAIARRSIRNAQDDVRDSILSLRTTLTNSLPLPKAIEDYAVEFGLQSGLDVRFQSSTDLNPPITPRANAEIIRIVQESLTNVRKHAMATSVEVTLMMLPNTLRITIADDGVGFDLHTSKPRHFGLATMQERAQEINGIVEIVSSQGEGTVVQLSVPLTLSV